MPMNQDSIGYGLYRPRRRDEMPELIKPLGRIKWSEARAKLRRARMAKKNKGKAIILCCINEHGEFMRFGV